MEQKKIVTEYFDNLSLDYQRAYDNDRKDPMRTYIFNERKKIVLDLIDKYSGRLLDIGCGPGIIAKDLIKRNFVIYNVDISPSMIEKAKSALKEYENSGRIFFKVCDMENLDFQEAYFDVILCIGVIEYLDDFRKSIEIIANILKKGGLVIISIPNKRSILNIIDDLLSGMAFRLIPMLFNGNKSMKKQGVKMTKFIPQKFVQELEKYGLTKIAMKFHVYRLASCRWIFPKFWILLSRIIGRINPPFFAPILANNCVIKFEKK